MDDIVVVGGGPAGSTIAALLAQRGFNVLLFEAERFPRPHIGESLLPATIEALTLSGVADKVRDAGFTIKQGATMAWGANQELWTWYFRETNTKQPHAYQVNRDEFDQILLDHARESGAEVHEGVAVDRVCFNEGCAIGVEVKGEFQSASFVVDATGQRSLLANQEQQKTWDDDFQNLAVYGYFHGGTHLADDAAGNILVESIPVGWLWKIPLKNNVSSVGVVADREDALKGIRGSSVDRWFREVISTSTYVNAHLQGSQPLGELTATRDWSYQAARFAGPRHCLIGDAACFIDPLFSTGVHLAVFSATLAAAYVTTVFRTPALASQAADAFDRQYRQHYQHFRELARLFYGSNRSIDSYFWQTRQITGEAQYTPREAFVRAVSGQASRGYERTTLSHGVLPPNFTAALQSLEEDRQARTSLTQTFTESMTFIAAEDVSIEDTALFNGEAFELGQVVRRPNLEDLPISAFVVDVVTAIQTSASSVTEIAGYLSQRGWENEVVAQSLGQTIQLLFVEGILERNDV